MNRANTAPQTRAETGPIRPFIEREFAAPGGATIAGAHWTGNLGPLVCVHGLTSSSRAFAGLATELPDWRVLAVDCRGRGQSSKNGPFGLTQHAADLAAVMDAAQMERATLVGHSMGAYIVSAFAAKHPQRVERLVLVDGGYFFKPLPPGMSSEQLLESLLGQFLPKLRRTWKSLDEYIDFYTQMPLYRHGVDSYARIHFEYDLGGAPPMLRARVTEACVADDWYDVLDLRAVGKRLEALHMPVLLLRASGGLTGVGDEVMPDSATAEIRARVPHLRVLDLPDTNHHTILLSVPGAQAVAKAIAEFQ